MKTKDYVKLIAKLNDGNPAPGGLSNLRESLISLPNNKVNKILEIGSNTGQSTLTISELYPNSDIIAIDIDSNMIKRAKENLKYAKSDNLLFSNDNINYQKGDVEKLEFKNNSFDLVISGGTLSFVNSREKAVKEVHRVLKPGGFFISLEYGYDNLPPKSLSKNVSEYLGFDVSETTIKYWTDLHLKEDFNLEGIKVTKPFIHRAQNIDRVIEQVESINRRNDNPISKDDLKLYKEALLAFRDNEPFTNIINLTLRKIDNIYATYSHAN